MGNTRALSLVLSSGKNADRFIVLWLVRCHFYLQVILQNFQLVQQRAPSLRPGDPLTPSCTG